MFLFHQAKDSAANLRPPFAVADFIEWRWRGRWPVHVDCLQFGRREPQDIEVIRHKSSKSILAGPHNG